MHELSASGGKRVLAGQLHVDQTLGGDICLGYRRASLSRITLFDGEIDGF
jgi:hypothetical protein